MPDTKKITAIRAITVVLLLLTIVLVAVAAGRCTYFPDYDGSYYCEHSGYPYTLPIESWGDMFFDRLVGVRGQFFVFVSSIILLLLSITSLILIAGQGSTHEPTKWVGICVALFGVILCFINGALEIWYSVGFSSGFFGAYGGYIKSWVAAAVFYFTSAFLYIADLIAVLASE